MASSVVKAACWLNGSVIPVANIDSTLFTHLFCAFDDLDPNTNQVTIVLEIEDDENLFISLDHHTVTR